MDCHTETRRHQSSFFEAQTPLSLICFGFVEQRVAEQVKVLTLGYTETRLVESSLLDNCGRSICS